MRLKTLITIFLLCLSHESVAACDFSKAEKSAAVSKIWTLPEVINWKNYVSSHQEKKPVISTVSVTTFKNKCFSRLSAYSDEVSHFHRWHDFYISQIGDEIYIDNTEGDFISLSEWRASADGKAWNSSIIETAQ